MSRSLKAYIVGVVALGAIALLVATLRFPAETAIAIPLPGYAYDSGVAIAAGVGFWIALTLISWALPVKLPFGTQQGVATAPMLAAMFLGGPAVAGWVAAIGTTGTADSVGPSPGTGPWQITPLSLFPRSSQASSTRYLPRSVNPLIDFVRAMFASGVFWALNVTLAGSLLGLRTNQPLATVLHRRLTRHIAK